MESHIIVDQEIEIKKEFIGDKLEHFEFLTILGEGDYGFVAKVKSKINQKIYAMKIKDLSLIKNEVERELSLNEINILESLDSPHIIKYYNHFLTKGKLYLLMEYIEQDIKVLISIHKKINIQIPEQDLWNIFYQCLSGLICIHKNNIIHRDIKPGNLFLTNDKIIKIGGFSSSILRKKNQNIIENKSEKESIIVGTFPYMSPELLKHDNTVDIYSLGCTFFEMCFFTPPRNPIPVMNLNPNLEITTDLQDIEIKYNKCLYSNKLKQIIRNMIEKVPEKRFNSENIFNMIKNEYNIIYKPNSSINSVIRCLFSFQNFKQSLLKHRDNFFNQNKIITKMFFLYMTI